MMSVEDLFAPMAGWDGEPRDEYQKAVLAAAEQIRRDIYEAIITGKYAPEDPECECPECRATMREMSE
jgi:hypothetical protein